MLSDTHITCNGFIYYSKQLQNLASVRRINEVLDTDIDLTDENAVYKDKLLNTAKSNLEKFTLNTIKTMKNGFWKISTS